MSYLVNRPAQNDVSDLQTLSGVPDGSTNLGTFTGNTVRDNPTVKEAVQDLETEVEDRLPDVVSWKVGSGQAYRFDGVNDFMAVQDPLVYNDGSRDIPFTVSVDFEKNRQAATEYVIANWNTALPNRAWILAVSDAAVSVSLADSSGNTKTASVTTSISTYVKYNITFVYEGGSDYSTASDRIHIYINGKKFNTTAGGAGSFAGVSNSTSDIWLARISATYSRVSVSRVVIMNRAASAADVVRLANGQRCPFADYGPSGTEITSGALVIGKRYRITNFQSGDNFSNVGAASNATGEEFIATGTTPTTWTNSSGITQIGEIVVHLPGGAAPTVWANQAGNSIGNAINTGAALINSNPLSADRFVSFTNLQTSAAGLVAGQVWRDGNDLKIV